MQRLIPQMLTQAAGLFPFGCVASPYRFFQSPVPRGMTNSWTSTREEGKTKKKEAEEKSSSFLIQHCQSPPCCETASLPTAGRAARVLRVFDVAQVSLKDLWKKSFFPSKAQLFFFYLFILFFLLPRENCRNQSPALTPLQSRFLFSP